jgi:uncharacterized glyoxalase superfamily protein PhnB
MKPGELVVIIDSVRDAAKFYTEKLAFDVVNVKAENPEDPVQLTSAKLRKGKFFIKFRVPKVEELADFSFIKRCNSRCVYLQVETKKGLDKYFERCSKKGVKVISEPKDSSSGYRTFSIKDNFGIKVVFVQKIENFTEQPKLNILNLPISKDEIKNYKKNEIEIVDKIIVHLKKFGILRRSSKKFAKSWLKEKANIID